MRASRSILFLALSGSCTQSALPGASVPITAAPPTGSSESTSLPASSAAPPTPPQAPASVTLADASSTALAVAKRFANAGDTDLQVGPKSETPECVGASCEYVFTASAAANGERTRLGVVYVDSSTGKVSYEPNDGRNKRWEPDAYAAYLAVGEKVVDAVASLPEVKRWCAWVEKQNAHCALWLDESSDVPCPAMPGLFDECLWSVYVGEIHPTHSARIATAFVVPGKWIVLSANTLACDRVSGADFERTLAAYRTGARSPKCAAP